MVAARKAVGNGWAALLLALQPEWVVLRPTEIEHIRAESPAILGKIYVPVRVFDVRKQAAAALVPDHFMLKFDAHFTVYRRVILRAPEPEPLGIQHQFGTEAPFSTLDGAPVRLVHASGTTPLRVPANATRFEIGYGILPDAYAAEPKTAAATFSVVWADGPRTEVLAVRTLDPAGHPGDRCRLTFAGPLPPSTSGRARLLLHNSPGRSTNKDWTCWGAPYFYPEQPG